MSYTKYYVYKKQYTTDGTTWADVVPVEWTPSGDPIGTYDTFEQCGENPPQYRTISGTPYCNGINKYVNTFSEISYDNGSTWEPAVPTSATVLVESTSMDCFKFYATYSDPKSRYKSCDGSTTITTGDTFQTGYVANRMTTAIIGNCVTAIGASAFTEFSSLTTVNISNNVTSIGSLAFYECRNLGNVTLPSGLTSIGDHAFGYCQSMWNVVIPASVTSIGDGAFVFCNYLDSITCLATTPPTLGNNTFMGTNDCPIYVPCDSITAYKSANVWSDYASRIEAIEGSCTTQYRWIADCWLCQGYDKWNKSKQQVSYDGGETWEDTGTVSATTLEESNSFNCGYGDSNPTSHHYYAEYSDGTRYAYDTDCDYTLTYAEANPDCYDPTKMTYAYIGGCYNTIGSVFSGHTSLSSVTIANNSNFSIGVYAFYQCSSLTSVTIPSGVVYIHDGAFKDCTSLQYVRVEATNPPSADTIFYGMFDNTNNCPIYVPSGSVQSYKTASHWSRYADRIQAPPSVTLYRWVESGWTCVGYDKYVNNIQQVSYDSGFTWENTSTTSASTLIETNSQDCGYLPSNVKYYFVASSDIYSGECDYNTTLSGVSYYSGVTLQAFIGECVTTIGNGCFEGFTNLNKVSISNSATTIGWAAFRNCTSLTSCTIGSSVTSIDEGAFSNCTSLASINIPNSVISIDVNTFYNCSGLTSCTVGSGVTTIGGFSNCTNLKRLNSETDGVFNIPNGVTYIGESGFTSCLRLTSIDIPSGVTSIGSRAFYGCNSLTSITINAATPPTLGTNVFYNTNNCPIYVPSGSVETYKAASGWSTYADRIQAIP